MEVSNLIACTENCICIDACLELPPNQYDPNNSPWMLLGKLITYKSIGISIILYVVNRAWRSAFLIRVSRLDNYTFIFHFQHEADMANAYRRRPQSIQGGHLVLKKWNPSLTWQEIPFTTSAFWVQVHGLPELWRSPNNLRLISGKVGNVVKVDLVRDRGGMWKRFICIQIEVKLNRPLIPTIFFPRNDLPHLQISLRYEKLADVCY